MTQHGIEMILMRRLAARLTIPIVLVDPRGDLVYFNPAAAGVLGRPFEAGPIARGEWSQMFRPAHLDGSAMKRDDLPLYVATDLRRPSHQRGWVRGRDGVERDVEGIAFPLIGQCERMLGAVGVFWSPADPPPRGRRRERASLDLASPGSDRPVELLLMRQLASYLTTAVLVLGPDGALVFYNESAEPLLGRPFEEAEEMGAEEWSELLEPRDPSGERIGLDARPMIVALRRQQPAHRRFSIRGYDGLLHDIEGLAFPLVDVDGWRNGIVGIFWEHART